MTPQERQLIDDLFDRLAKLESAKRDPEAMSAIMQGLRNAPNAVYALVQTTLVQDEALKRADMRIQELEALAGQQNQSGGFLDSMRDAIFGQNQPQGLKAHMVRCPTFARPRSPAAAGRPGTPGRCCSRTRRPGNINQPAYAQPYGGAQQQPSAFGGGGGSFLGTAAAAAVGVVGGSMLAGSLRSMMGGGGNHQSFGDTAGHSGGIEDRRPWSDQSGGDLARDAGINDIGSRGSSSQRADNNDNDSGSRQGFFDQASHDDDRHGPRCRRLRRRRWRWRQRLRVSGAELKRETAARSGGRFYFDDSVARMERSAIRDSRSAKVATSREPVWVPRSLATRGYRATRTIRSPRPWRRRRRGRRDR